MDLTYTVEEYVPSYDQILEYRARMDIAMESTLPEIEPFQVHESRFHPAIDVTAQIDRMRAWALV